MGNTHDSLAIANVTFNLMNLVVAIFNDPADYPPTLRALKLIGTKSERIDVIYRQARNLKSAELAESLHLKPVRYRSSGKAGITSKILNSFEFLSFSTKLLFAARRRTTNWVLVYDPVALVAYQFIRKFTGSGHKVWYHNHDVIEQGSQYSSFLTKWALKKNNEAFPYIDLFTLPAQERLGAFPIDQLKGEYRVIPNYPLISSITKNINRKPDKEVNLMFRGTSSNSRGLTELFPILGEQSDGKTWRLHITGRIHPQYRSELLKYANQIGVKKFVIIHGELIWDEVWALTELMHIGIAFYLGGSFMDRTIGTASNKIYEYAAAGLPVIYNNSKVLSDHLSSRKWAFPAQADSDSIRTAITEAISNYEDASQAAVHDSRNELNFESVFQHVSSIITP